jgi:fatty acid desaturase
MGTIGELITGHSMYIWNYRHVFTHHIHTNVCGVDPDIGIYMCSPKKPLLTYRDKVAVVPSWFQPFLYFVIVMQMQYDDFISFWRRHMENTKINDTGLQRSIEFYGAKIFFAIHRIVLPLMLGYRGLMSVMFLFFITEIIGGYLFGIFSQITHVNEEVEWPSDQPINEDWGTLQVKTAVDYAPESIFWTYISGYLNYQIPHHLFPSVAPHHYYELLPMIKETCKDYGIKYLMYDSVWQCAEHHFAHLKGFQHFRDRYYSRITKDPTKKSTLPIDRVDEVFQFLFSGFSKGSSKSTPTTSDTQAVSSPNKSL